MPSGLISLRCRIEIGTLSTVRRLRLQTPRHIGRGIVSARHLLTLAQGARARLEVVVPHLVRRRHRRIVETQLIGHELVAALGTERIGFLGKCDRVLFAACDVPHHDARQAVFTLEPDQPVREQRDTEHVNSATMRDQIAPVLAPAVGERRDRDLEILGAVARSCAPRVFLARPSSDDARHRIAPTFRAPRRAAVLHPLRSDRPARIPRSRDRAPKYRRSVRTACGRAKRRSGCPFLRKRARRRLRACRAGDDRPARAGDCYRAARNRMPMNRRSTPASRKPRERYPADRRPCGDRGRATCRSPSLYRPPTMRAAGGRANAAVPPSWKNALPAASASPSSMTCSSPPSRG